jgi:hypothetical protein
MHLPIRQILDLIKENVAFFRSPIRPGHSMECFQEFCQRRSDVNGIVDLNVEDSVSRHPAAEELADGMMDEKGFPDTAGTQKNHLPSIK